MLTEIIKRYHEIAQLRPEDIFGEESSLIAVNHPENGRTASPGWVGRGYPAQRIVFLGFNPGGGGDAAMDPADVELYRNLRNFKHAESESEIIAAFHKYNNSWMEIQNGHKIGWLISILIDAINRDIQQAAFLNFIHFRTCSNKIPDKKSKIRAWELASSKQFSVLEPKILFILSKKAADTLTQLGIDMPCRTIVISRTNGDRYLSEQAKNVIAQLRQEAESAQKVP